MANLVAPKWLEASTPSDMHLTQAEGVQISQGAEARVWATTFFSRPAIIKQRFNKKYRHPTLDAVLTTQRLKSEVRSMIKARKLGVAVPLPFYVEHTAGAIYMEHVQGQSLKQVLHSGQYSAERTREIMAQVGIAVAKIHDGGLIHGDLTTSNMMLRVVASPASTGAPAAGSAALGHDPASNSAAAAEQGTGSAAAPQGAGAEGGKGAAQGEVVLIDFGLAHNSIAPEDKGVDLYVFERALSSAHSEQEGLFKAFMEAYQAHSGRWSSTFNRFAEIRLRGRKRTMVG